jgi:hypothetical protein
MPRCCPTRGNQQQKCCRHPAAAERSPLPAPLAKFLYLGPCQAHMAKATHGNYKFIIMSKIVKSQAHRYGTDGIDHNGQRNETCAVPLREKRRIAARNCVGESLDKRLAMRIPNLRQKKIVMRNEQVVALHRRFGGQRRRGARPVCHLKSSASINHWSR